MLHVTYLEEMSLHIVDPVARLLFPFAMSWNASCADVTGIRRWFPARNTPAV